MFAIDFIIVVMSVYWFNCTVTKHIMLEDQLATFIYDVLHDKDFIDIRDLGGLI